MPVGWQAGKAGTSGAQELSKGREGGETVNAEMISSLTVNRVLAWGGLIWGRGARRLEGGEGLSTGLSAQAEGLSFPEHRFGEP